LPPQVIVTRSGYDAHRPEERNRLVLEEDTVKAKHFVPINLGNGVTLDYDDAPDPQPHHYAFLVSEDVFDAAFERATTAGIPYHAEPSGGRPGEIYHSGSGGRGFYFSDPDDHLMELLTRDLSGRQASD
jgi:catechol 2,3-dioxygenase-like lactoylglutathione lyase family enzyme